MTWQIDPAHSSIYFTARHMMISKVRGQFPKFSGTVNFDETNPANTTVTIEVDLASVTTDNEQRDNHLRSADFFDVTNYPTMRFVSKRVEQDDANNGRLIGDLTIKNITKEVVLNVEYSGQHRSPWGTTNAGFSATATVNRKEWELNWNVALEAGGWLVGDKINIEIELELIKVPEAQPETAVAA